jgi:hypothetical protein
MKSKNQHIDFENIPFEGQNKKNITRLLFIYGIVVGSFVFMMVYWVFDNNKMVNGLYLRANSREKVLLKQRNADGSLIATQEQRILELTKENMALLETVSKFKSIQGQVSIQTRTIIKDKLVPYPVEVVKYVDTNSQFLYLRIPTNIEQCDSSMCIRGVIGIDGFEIDSLSIPNKLTITTGRVKSGIFSKDKYIVEVTSSSPHVDIINMQNTQFKAERPVYKRWWFGFGLGAAAGIFIKSR